MSDKWQRPWYSGTMGGAPIRSDLSNKSLQAKGTKAQYDPPYPAQATASGGGLDMRHIRQNIGQWGTTAVGDADN
eukprot:102383-Karenia_brevis.AAC.1